PLILLVNLDPIANESLDDLEQLREENLRRRLARVLFGVVPRQSGSHFELALLKRLRGPPGCQVELRRPARLEERRPAMVQERGLELDLVRNVHRVNANRRDRVPIDSHPVPDPLLVAL